MCLVVDPLDDVPALMAEHTTTSHVAFLVSEKLTNLSV